MNNSTSVTIGPIASSSASSRPSLLDTNIGSSSSIIGPQNPRSALQPKPKKNEQTLTVWEHFTKLELSDSDDHKSQCNYCKSEFNYHPRSHGTLSMLQHIRKNCKKYPGRFDKTQSKLSFETKREGQAAVSEGSSGNLVIDKFNASKIRAAISKMIIVDELPFRFVEGEGFQDFMKTVEPRFSIPSRFTIMRDCFKLFMSEKEKLRMFLTSGVRVCLTTDCWTSIQNLNYMCITTHFIDSEWNLHKRI
jgi:hypothetical protein